MRVVVTGASRGIGLELVGQCLARGDRVHAGVRDPVRAAAVADLAPRAGGRLHVGACDVTDDASVAAFAAGIPAPVHLLVNNAGVRTRPDGLLELDARAVLATYDVNALGALRVTRALAVAGRFAPGGKVVNVSSALGSIAGTGEGGGYGYRMSKAALNMASRSLAMDLRGAGVVVVAMNPGWVRTDMGGDEAPLGVTESVAAMLSVIDRLGDGDTGRFLGLRGETIPW